MTPTVAAVHDLLREEASYDLQAVPYTYLLFAVVEIFDASGAPAARVDVHTYGT